MRSRSSRYGGSRVWRVMTGDTSAPGAPARADVSPDGARRARRGGSRPAFGAPPPGNGQSGTLHGAETGGADGRGSARGPRDSSLEGPPCHQRAQGGIRPARLVLRHSPEALTATSEVLDI